MFSCFDVDLFNNVTQSIFQRMWNATYMYSFKIDHMMATSWKQMQTSI